MAAMSILQRGSREVNAGKPAGVSLSDSARVKGNEDIPVGADSVS